MSDIMVKVEGVSKKFSKNLKSFMLYGIQDIGKSILSITPKTEKVRSGEFWSLDNVSFELKRGECLGLIGQNGAGKSTLLKILNGIISPDKGRVEIKGRVGALIEVGAGFHPMLTGRENIYVNGSILGLSKKDIDKKFDEIVDFAEIGEFIDSPVKHYSSGMYVRLGFAIAAQMALDVMLIDEVLAVGDVGFRMKCYNHILRLMDSGTSIIVVTHNVEHLSRVTNRAVVLDKGKKVFDGPLAVGTGIYQNHVKIPNDKQHVEGKPRIDSVRLLDEEGNEKREFLTGETLLVDITIKTDNTHSGTRLIVAVLSPAAGILGSFSTPYKNFNFDITPPATTIRLVMPDLPLLIGGYHLNISLYGPQITDFFERLAPATTFQIIGPPTNAFGFGVSDRFYFEHIWKQV